MSIRHQAMIWEDAYYQQGDKAKLLVALAIADSARGEDGKAWPSIEYLARKARTSIRGVQEACRSLESDRRLVVELNKGPKGTNLYTVLEVTPQPLHPRNEAPEKPAEKAPEKPAEDCAQTISNRKQPLQEPEETLPAVPAAAVDTGEGHSGLVADWCAYMERRTKSPYPFTARDAKAAKQLIAHFKTKAAVKAFIRACHARQSEGYPFGGTDTLYDIANSVARLQAALAKPARVPHGETGAARKARQSAGQYALQPGEGPDVFDPMKETAA